MLTPDDPSHVVTDSNGDTISSDRVVVKFKYGVSESDIQDIVSGVDGEITGYIPQIEVYEIKVPTSTANEIENIISQLNSNSSVNYAEKNYTGTLGNTDVEEFSGFVVWGFEKVKLSSGDTSTETGYSYLRDNNLYGETVTEVVVAVIDSGFNREHPDLKDQLLPGYDVADDDNNTTNKEMDSSWGKSYTHGTHTAGLIAAENNGKAINGVAYRAKILPVKLISSSSIGALKQCIFGYKLHAAINYAVSQGADIINISAHVKDTQALRASVRHARLNGVTVVACAGNEEVDASNTFPAAYPEVISVGATDKNDERATGWDAPETGSNYSENDLQSVLSLSAPGEEITVLNADYPDTNDPLGGPVTGTSFAAPFVSGLAALLKSLDESLTPNEIEEIMRDTADDISVTYPDSSVHTWKRINALKAVKAVKSVSGRFTDLGNGVISDSNTGLLWEKGQSDILDWQNAMQYCQDLSLGGSNSWRAPTKEEFESLFMGDTVTCGPSAGGDYTDAYLSDSFNCYEATVWSATEYDADNAYRVNFRLKKSEPASKTTGVYATRCVKHADCSDGVDNDGDGLVDYPEDYGCHSANDSSEEFVSVDNLRSDVNTTYNETSPFITSDGLRLYFLSDRTTGYGWDFYYAERDDTSSSFNTPVYLSSLSTGENEGNIWMSDDELRAYFTRYANGLYRIFTASRPDLTDSFGTATEFSNLVWDDSSYNGSLMPDEKTIYFRSNGSGGEGPPDIYKATRSNIGDAFGTPQNISELNTSSREGDPCLSRDGLTMFFHSNRSPNSGKNDIWYTWRTDKASAWNTPVKVTELSTEYNESPGKGCMNFENYLYYNRNVDGDTQIFYAIR
ncbi:MAG: S8 family serine peptidase, partial [bacterium]